MSTHTYLGRCDVPDPSCLPDRKARRKFRTGTYSTTVIEEINRIDTGGGTEKNRARAEGTDTVHADALFNEFERGIRYDQLPPIVIKTGSVYQLVDGFTRVRALQKRKQEKWVFDVYELNEGFKLRDLLDEIGLKLEGEGEKMKLVKGKLESNAAKEIQSSLTENDNGLVDSVATTGSSPSPFPEFFKYALIF